jgi:hypothetical protein
MQKSGFTLRMPNPLDQQIRSVAADNRRNITDEICLRLEQTLIREDIRHRLDLAAAGNPQMTISEFISDLDREMPAAAFSLQG